MFDTPMQKRIEDRITHGKGFSSKIYLRWNPPRTKHYHDGMLIDWKNLGESNRQYMERLKNSDINIYKIPRMIEQILPQN